MIVEVTVRVLPDDGADQMTIAIASLVESVPQVDDFEQNMLRAAAKASELAERAGNSTVEQIEMHVEQFKRAAPASSSPTSIGRVPRTRPR